MDGFYFCLIKYSFTCCFLDERKSVLEQCGLTFSPFPLSSGCIDPQNASRLGYTRPLPERLSGKGGTKTHQKYSPSSCDSSKTIIQKVNIRDPGIRNKSTKCISVLSGQHGGEEVPCSQRSRNVNCIKI